MPDLQTRPVKPWQWIAAMQDDPDVTSSELRLLALVRWADYATGGDIRPGDEQIAKAIRAESVQTVRRLRKSLTDKGYLSVVRKGHGQLRFAAVYQLTVPVRQPVTGDLLDETANRSPVTANRSRVISQPVTGDPPTTPAPNPPNEGLSTSATGRGPKVNTQSDSEETDEMRTQEDYGNREFLARKLDVPAKSVGWFAVDLAGELYAADEDKFHDAVEKSVGKTPSPVGYLVTICRRMLDMDPEIEKLLPRLERVTGLDRDQLRQKFKTVESVRATIERVGA